MMMPSASVVVLFYLCGTTALLGAIADSSAFLGINRKSDAPNLYEGSELGDNIAALHAIDVKSGKRCAVHGSLAASLLGGVVGARSDLNFSSTAKPAAAAGAAPRPGGSSHCEMGTWTHKCSAHRASDAVSGALVAFRPRCLGSGGRDDVPDAMPVSVNVSLLDASEATYDEASPSTFATLALTMHYLGHDSADFFKFDIEGFEWDRFVTEIPRSDGLAPVRTQFDLREDPSDRALIRKEDPKRFDAASYKPKVTYGPNGMKVSSLYMGLYETGCCVMFDSGSGSISSCQAYAPLIKHRPTIEPIAV